MAGKREVKVVISGDSSGAQSAATKSAGAFDKTGTAGEKLSSRMSKAFGSLGSQIGGEFGDVLNTASEGLDKFADTGSSKLAKITASGAALAGVGGVLTAMGDKEKQASQQLGQAISNVGQNIDDYQGRIDKAVKSNEKYGISAVTTKDALSTLTTATHDETKALNLMPAAADYAAAKHISLNDAAAALAKGLNGNTKIFKQYGIVIKTNADGTKDYAGAVTQLANLVKGQASASTDTWTGKLKALRTEVGDDVAAFGEKYGPTITAFGVTAMTAAPLIKGLGTVVHSAGDYFKGMSANAVTANEEALGSTTELAAGVQTSTDTQLASFTEVATGAKAASAAAVESDQAAEASTGELAAAVQSSTAAQLASFGQVAAGARATATAATTADEEMIAANEAAAASTVGTSGGILAGIGKFAAGLGPLVAIGAGIGALGAAINHLDGDYASWSDNQKNINNLLGSNKQAVDSFSQSVEQDGGTIGTLTQHLVGAQLQTAGFDKTAAGLGTSLADMITGVSGTDAQFQGLIGTLDKSGKFTTAQMTALFGLRKSLMDGKTSENDLATATSDLTVKQSNAVAVTAAWTTALQTLGQAQIGDLQSQDAFITSLSNLTAGVKDNGKSLSINTDKGRANRDAFLSAGSAALSYAQAQQKNGVPIATVTKNLEANVLQLERSAEKAGFSKTQVQALVKQMGLTPKQINTIFATATASATKAVTDYVHKLTSIDGKTVHTFVEISATGKGAGFGATGGLSGSVNFALAEGGVMPYDGVGVVGEQGPERVVKHGSHVEVIPIRGTHSGGPAMSSDGGASTLTVNLVLDGNVVHQSLLKVRRGKGGVGLQLG